MADKCKISLLDLGRLDVDDGFFIRGATAAVPSNPHPAHDRRRVAVVAAVVEHPQAGPVLFDTGSAQNASQDWPEPVRDAFPRTVYSDATGTERAVLVSLSRGASYALHLAATCPDRVAAQVFISPTTPLAPFSAARMPYARRFEEQLGSDHGWAKDNAAYWQRDYAGFLEFFFAQVFPEPHSTKQIEDAIGWGRETTRATLIDTRRGAILDAGADIGPLLGQVRGPCLVIQGTEDAIVGPAGGPLLARALGERATLVELAGSGHSPHARDPVKVNLLIRDFVDGLQRSGPSRRWTRGSARPKRALYLSSPIGLGHARRDAAVDGLTS
jgi:hypothetical protein